MAPTTQPRKGRMLHRMRPCDHDQQMTLERGERDGGMRHAASSSLSTWYCLTLFKMDDDAAADIERLREEIRSDEVVRIESVFSLNEDTVDG